MTNETIAKAAIQAMAMPTLAPVERDLPDFEDDGALEVNEGVAEAMAKVEVDVAGVEVEEDWEEGAGDWEVMKVLVIRGGVDVGGVEVSGVDVRGVDVCALSALMCA